MIDTRLIVAESNVLATQSSQPPGRQFSLHHELCTIFSGTTFATVPNVILWGMSHYFHAELFLKEKNDDLKAKTLNIVYFRFRMMEFSGANAFDFEF